MYSLADNHKLFTQTVIDTINQTTNARKLYDVSVSELLVVKANYDLLSDLLDVDYVSANLLDALATQVGTSRLPGESDADLKKKIVTTAISKSSSGTIPELIAIIKAFDPVNTYVINENPTNDFTRWTGEDILNGTFSLDARNSGTLHIERYVDDVDTVNYSIADFIYSARAAGTNVILSMFINLTNCTHYISPSVSVQNTEKFSDLGTLDGSKLFTQFVGKYNVTSYKVFDVNNEVVKESPFKPRFLNGIMIYSALLREGEANNKQIKKIQFFDGVTLNFECVLPVAILKKQSIRILFYEENLL